MNEQQKKAAEYAEILLAFSRGEKVEGERNGRWQKLGDPAWNFEDRAYRIAPKPVEVWVRFAGCPSNSGMYAEKWECEAAADRFGGRAILMREVTE